MSVERMAWSGACGSCLTGVIAFPTEEQTQEQQEEVSATWPESMSDCLMPDCDGTIDWNGNDPIESVLSPRML